MKFIKTLYKNTVNLLVGAFSFLIFIISSQLFTLLLLLPLPISKNTYMALISKYARFTLKTNFNIKITEINNSGENFQKPAIVICNHHSIIDIPVVLMQTHKLAIVTTDWLSKSKAKFLIGKFTNLIQMNDGLENGMNQIKEQLSKGNSIMVFPEGQKNMNKAISRFHKGAFYLSEITGLDIVPIFIYATGDLNKKGWFYLKRGKLIVKIFDRIKNGDSSYGTTYQEKTKFVTKLYRSEFEQAQKTF